MSISQFPLAGIKNVLLLKATIFVVLYVLHGIEMHLERSIEFFPVYLIY